MLTFEIDVSELKERVAAAMPELEANVERANIQAAEEGIRAAQTEHPYTDRTGDLTGEAHVEPDGNGKALMVWPMEYATFVDEGTSRAAAYPFTPLAEKVAADALPAKVEAAVEEFAATITR